MMRVRPVLMFDHPNCADIGLSTNDAPDGGLVLQILQEESTIWIPIEHAAAFADALKAFAAELA